MVNQPNDHIFLELQRLKNYTFQISEEMYHIYTEYGYRIKELKQARQEIELLKKQIAEETKEKYAFKVNKELTEDQWNIYYSVS